MCIEMGLLLYIANSNEEKGQNEKSKKPFLLHSEFNHLIGTFTQPFAKAMAKITKGVDIPNMII